MAYYRGEEGTVVHNAPPVDQRIPMPDRGTVNYTPFDYVSSRLTIQWLSGADASSSTFQANQTAPFGLKFSKFRITNFTVRTGSGVPTTYYLVSDSLRSATDDFSMVNGVMAKNKSLLAAATPYCLDVGGMSWVNMQDHPWPDSHFLTGGPMQTLNRLSLGIADSAGNLWNPGVGFNASACFEFISNLPKDE
jgi:hypothetical protein